VDAEPGARNADGSPVTAMDVRTVQEWSIRPQLLRVPGVVEVDSNGGFESQFHVTPNPAKLLAYDLSFHDLLEALDAGNGNVGAGFIEHNGEQYLIRAPGQLSGPEEIRQIVVARRNNIPIRLGDIAEVGLGKELRTGAATHN